MSPADLVVLSASAVATVTDVRTRRIPNAVVAALCTAGAALCLRQGPSHLLVFAAILIVALLAGTLAHASGIVGGGDVKFISAATATLGLHDAPLFLAATFAAGGVLALVVALQRGELRATLRNVVFLTTPLLAGVRPAPLTAGTKIPYSLAFLSGALAVTIAHVIP